MLENICESDDRAPPRDRRIQDVFGGQFFVAAMAFFIVEFFYNFNAEGEKRWAMGRSPLAERPSRPQC